MNIIKYRFKETELGVFSKSSDEIAEKITKSCRVMGISDGTFSLIDIIHSILNKIGSAHVVCVTWSAGIKDANQVAWMMDNNIIRSFKLITDRSYKTRQKSYALSIEDLFGLENIRTSDVHAKFVLIHNENYKICIRTSMNLNANKTCESFELDEDQEVFDFYMGFVEFNFGEMPKGFNDKRFIIDPKLKKYFNKGGSEFGGFNF